MPIISTELTSWRINIFSKDTTKIKCVFALKLSLANLRDLKLVKLGQAHLFKNKKLGKQNLFGNVQNILPNNWKVRGKSIMKNYKYFKLKKK